jgi:hypothetical protein
MPERGTAAAVVVILGLYAASELSFAALWLCPTIVISHRLAMRGFANLYRSDF